MYIFFILLNLKINRFYSTFNILLFINFYKVKKIRNYFIEK